MRILVTGASGFTGRQMMEFLSLQKGVEPVGLIRSRPHMQSPVPRVQWVAADLLDRDHLSKKISSTNPDAIIHLAGLTHGTPDDLLATNVNGTRNLLDAGTAANPACRILVVSSSAVYGYAGDRPIPESAPLKPLTDYGISKVTQDTLALDYNETKGTAIAVARPFNLTGPGLSEAFVCGKIIDQVVALERKETAALNLLETQSARDFIDVRDVVKGYFSLITHPDFSGDCAGRAFNLGSGRACSIAELIATIEAITGTHYSVSLPPTHPPIPLPFQQSDNTRITSTTGWRPEIALKETLSDMLEATRKKKS
jgi:GDP-4-dehydro-6-deoxy-D-mannose reductase